MKSKRIVPVVALAMLVFAGAASSQQPTKRITGIAPIEVGTVTKESLAVHLKAVGKEVARGVFEVNPSSIVGKRLILPDGNGGTARFHICIGRWSNGGCNGIFIGSD